MSVARGQLAGHVASSNCSQHFATRRRCCRSSSLVDTFFAARSTASRCGFSFVSRRCGQERHWGGGVPGSRMVSRRGRGLLHGDRTCWSRTMPRSRAFPLVLSRRSASGFPVVHNSAVLGELLRHSSRHPGSQGSRLRTRPRTRSAESSLQASLQKISSQSRPRPPTYLASAFVVQVLERRVGFPLSCR